MTLGIREKGRNSSEIPIPSGEPGAPRIARANIVRVVVAVPHFTEVRVFLLLSSLGTPFRCIILPTVGITRNEIPILSGEPGVPRIARANIVRVVVAVPHLPKYAFFWC
jgi:hypothetical protein